MEGSFMDGSLLARHRVSNNIALLQRQEAHARDSEKINVGWIDRCENGRV
jgi:hypothetical protein